MLKPQLRSDVSSRLDMQIPSSLQDADSYEQANGEGSWLTASKLRCDQGFGLMTISQQETDCEREDASCWRICQTGQSPGCYERFAIVCLLY